MNLYVAGWDLTEQDQTTAVRCLQEISRDYPSLDASMAWRAPQGRAFAACVQSDPLKRGTRQYIHEQPNEIVLFDGCMADSSGALNAMRADNLAVHWPDLPDRLEGNFSIVRICPQAPSMELLTDFLGMAQVFRTKFHGKVVISNSVRILTRMSQDDALDPLGVSLTLSLGWAGGDRTLNRAVQIVPGNTHWKWTGGTGSEPVQLRRDYQAALVQAEKKTIGQEDAITLSNRMITMLRALGDKYRLQCPLTGGRDSRLMLSFLLRSNLSSDYYTDATNKEEDVRTAVDITNTLRLPLRIHRPSTEYVCDQWDALLAKLIRQNDGLVSLWQIANMIPGEYTTPEMPVRLYGNGGEIARRHYNHPQVLLLKNNGQAGAAKWLEKHTMSSHSGLVNDSAMALARQHMHHWVERTMDDGYSVAELPDCFYTFERVRRWVGSNSRKVQDTLDIFAPLCTKAFVESAFRLPVWSRFSEPIHYQLTRLVPELHKLPFGSTPWPTQIPGLALPHLALSKKIIQPLAKKLSRASQSPEGLSFDIHKLVNRQRLNLRTFCLDHTDSSLWNFVDRDRFEETTRSDIDARNTDILCQIATLFYYEVFQKQPSHANNMPPIAHRRTYETLE